MGKKRTGKKADRRLNTQDVSLRDKSLTVVPPAGRRPDAAPHACPTAANGSAAATARSCLAVTPLPVLPI